MTNDPGTVSIWHIIVVIVSGITGLLVALGIWILNSVSKRVSEVKETAGDAHKRIDALQDDRRDKWLEQARKCSDENSKLTEIRTILRNKGFKINWKDEE